MACEIYKPRRGRPPKKGKTTDSLKGIKFNFERYYPRRGRPKKKEAGL